MKDIILNSGYSDDVIKQMLHILEMDEKGLLKEWFDY